MPDISPLIRLFVSSTFADFTIERDVLQRMVFPRLRQLCEAQGCRFQPIDLRWGVSEEAGNEKRTLTICFEEIRRCQQLSPDLNFLILLGDRYGSCFLPATIPSTQVARLLPHLNTKEQDIFRDTYHEDLNALSPENVLLPNTAGGRNDEQLRTALGRAARAAGFSPEKLLPFVASATHLEIQRGLLATEADPTAVVCAMRAYTPTPASNDALDYMERDSARSAQVESLKHAVEERLKGRLQRYIVPWDANGPVLDREALARQLQVLLEPRVREALARRQAAARTRDPVCEANSQFAAARASTLVGREGALATVTAYLSNQLPFPLIVTGASGVGKSSLLARAVEDATRTHPDAVVVTRYIGVTPGTGSLFDLLSGLHAEIAQRYGQPVAEPLNDLSQVVAAVAKQLGTLVIPPERPLFLFLDALDQLGAERQRLDWLPLRLAPHVRMVLSLLSDRPELEDLRAWMPEGQELQLDPLTRMQGAEVLRAWLSTEGRQLTPNQEAAILDGFAPAPQGRGTPLYLRLAFEQAHTWRSFDPVNPPPPTVPALIQTYFTELEKPGRHGRELVAFALGDVAAAKHGLVEDELLDLLPRSSMVRDALRLLNPDAPPIDDQQSLPTVLWARLHADLDRYLTEREADGARLVTFYHRQVREEAERRYLGGPEGKGRHTELATYFADPAKQPYRLRDGTTWIWNRRKLAELAYQQAGMEAAGRQALETTLTDGRFLEGKLATEGIAAALDDLTLASDEADIKKLVAVVRSGAVVLTKDPAELANQIVGRVGSVSTLHHLPSHTAPWMQLRSQSLRTDHAILQILQGHLGEVLACALSADGQRALSASEDGTLRVWDTASGETLRTLDDKMRNNVVTLGRTLGNQVKAVDGCALSADGKRALSLKAPVLRLWDTTSGQVLRTFPGRVGDPGRSSPSCALSADGRLALVALSTLIGNIYAVKVVLWDTTSGQIRLTWTVRSSYFGTYELSADGARALIADHHSFLGEIWVRDTTSGQVHRALFHHTGNVACCAMSADGRRVLSASDAGELRLWDVESGQVLRTLKGRSGPAAGLVRRRAEDFGRVLRAMKGQNGTISRCALNADGQVALFVTTDGAVHLWNTETGNVARAFEGVGLRIVRNVNPQRQGTACALSADGRTLLTASDLNTLQLWDITSEEAPSRAQKSMDREGIVCALSGDGRQALTGYADGTLCLWDTNTSQTLRTWQGHTNPVLKCALSTDGQVALSFSNWDAMRIWDTSNQTTLIALKNRARVVHSGALSADGRFALSCRSTSLLRLPARLTLQLWDTRRKRPLRTFKGTRGAGFACALSAYGEIAMAASQDGFSIATIAAAVLRLIRNYDKYNLYTSTLRIWDGTSGSLLHSLTIDGWVEECVLCADGRRALYIVASALGHGDGALYAWDIARSKPILMLAGDIQNGVVACALSADGQQALSASADGTLRLWDTVDGHELTRWTHDRDFYSCALSADGRRAVAVDIAGSIHVLDVVSVAPTTDATGTNLPMS